MGAARHGRPSTRSTWARGGVVGVVVLTACTLLGTRRSDVTHAAPALPTVTIFDADPNHIWNRTYVCLMVRQGADGIAYGEDTPDPLLWDETEHLLEGESHRRALECLDEFLRGHGERAIADPLKRAIFQHDLWAVFDWAAKPDDPDDASANLPPARRELCVRLAEVIRRLAVSADELKALPDNYAAAVGSGRFRVAYDPAQPQQAFLPDLFQPDGPWVCLSAHLEEPTAIQHFTGRSRFLVFLRLPGPRAATIEYVEKLRVSGEPPMVTPPADSSHPASIKLLNLRLPQFPAGTQAALVRQVILINQAGKLVPTALTDLVEMRGYHAVTIGRGSEYMNYINGPGSRDQDFFEFRMSRPELFAGRNGGLLAVHTWEREYPTFATHGLDPFESPDARGEGGEILKRCLGCHSDSGIHSVESRHQWMKPSQASGNPWDLSAAISWETEATLARKKQQPEFLMLQRMWNGAEGLK